ncbi:MAG: toxin-antitoxin system HicB family antitoxin [Pirellulales bacterium]|nr:toxin-antitoxin system HicB family antitoxin [Pirellulales bacterium]
MEKQQEVFRVAHDLYRQNPDWVTFFREVLGTSGIIRQMYLSPQALTEFEKTPEYQEIQMMLAQLRVSGPTAPEDKESTRVITVRLPQCLHESLYAEAHEKHTSMNQLCISKLVQWLDSNMAALKLAANGSKPRKRKEQRPEVATAAT